MKTRTLAVAAAIVLAAVGNPAMAQTSASGKPISRADAAKIADLEAQIAEEKEAIEYIRKTVVNATERNEQIALVTRKIGILENKLKILRRQALPELPSTTTTPSSSNDLNVQVDRTKLQTAIWHKTGKKLSDRDIDVYLKVKKTRLGPDPSDQQGPAARPGSQGA